MIHKERFIILKTMVFGETDVIVHGLTRKGEKLNLIAKGAKRSRKRFGGGVLEPSHYVEAVYSRKAYDVTDERLFVLQEAQLIDGFTGIRSKYERLQAAFHFLHLVDRVSTYGLAESEELFNLLGNGLKTLETCQRIDLLQIQFESKLLREQGVLENAQDFSLLLERPLAESDQVPLDSIATTHLAAQLHTQLANY